MLLYHKYAFDGDVNTAYASKDNKEVKYLETEVDSESAVDKIYIVGRYDSVDGEGTYANRINGARIYASDSPMNGDTSKGVLVGEVTGVTATSEYSPAEINIDTNGENYKYYMIYFDTANNKGSVSMAAAEIEFYSLSFADNKQKLDLASESAPLAVDNNVFTAQTASEGEFVFELEAPSFIDIVVIKKQKNACGTSDDDYWADWVLSVGCEVQGSLDGDNWETIGKMNSWPDGKDNSDSEVFTLETPQMYKYIRYVRTEVKDSSSYGAWKFPSDNGNRLNLAEIEVYSPYMLTVTEENKTDTSSVFKVKGAEGMYKAYWAAYDESGNLINLEVKPIIINNNEAILEFENVDCYKTKLYIWNDMIAASPALNVE